MTTSEATVSIVPDEREVLLATIASQNQAFRFAVSGVTEAQARSVPGASAMSLSSLLNHVIQGENSAIDRIAGTDGQSSTGNDPTAAWLAGWQVADDESVADQLARLNEAAERMTKVVRAEQRLDRIVDLPDDVRKWMPADIVPTVRWMLLHQIEELARHAGHADIIRESLDGATADQLRSS